MSLTDTSQAPHDVCVPWKKPSSQQACESDAENVRGSSDASVDIITEHNTASYDIPERVSPRKPLPTQWRTIAGAPDDGAADRVRAVQIRI